MLGGGRAGGLVRRREAGRRLERARSSGLVERVDEDPRLRRDELGRAADARRDDGLAAAIASRIDWPNGSSSDGAQTTSAAAR